MPLKLAGMFDFVRGMRAALRPWLQWWLTELRLLWNDALDRLLPAARVVTEVRPLDGGFDLVRRRGREVLQTHRIAALEVPLPEGIVGTRAMLALPAHEVLIRRLVLPAAIESRLRESLTLRIDRDMPLKSELVSFDFAVAARDARAATIAIDLAIARQSSIEAWEGKMRDAGLRPIVIGVLTGEPPVPRFSFMRRHGGSPNDGGSRRRAGLDRPLMAGAAVLALAIVGVTGWQWRSEREAMNAALATLRADAQSAQQMRTQLLEHVETARELRVMLKGAPLSTALADLSGSVAQDAWVQMLQFRGREIRINGVAANTPALVAQLERSTVFEDVKLASTVSAGIGTGEDRFEVVLHTREAAP